MAETDPSVIRSLAISVDDCVDAFVYTRENPGTAVLRVTPPFHGRMRARLHVFHVDDSTETGAIHVSPAALLDDAVVDEYPSVESSTPSTDSDDSVDATGGDERDSVGPSSSSAESNSSSSSTDDRSSSSDAGETSTVRSDSPDGGIDPTAIREAHADAVDAWRERARKAVVDSVVLERDGERDDRRDDDHPLGRDGVQTRVDVRTLA